MHFDTFTVSDIDTFLKLATEEEWICDPLEFDFLFRIFPQGSFVARGATGQPHGFITSIAYCKSGWIGNLIVRKDERRNGIGAKLMKLCLETLASSSVRTVWLTASSSGAPLYERLGFKEIDRIVRWRRDGALLVDSDDCQSESCISDLLRIDQAGWGDDRSILCREKVRNGRLHAVPGGAMVVQKIEISTLIGPWVADIPESADKLLDSAMKAGVQEGSTFLDLPVSNSYGNRLLEKNGFVNCTETVLMYLGDRPDYRSDTIFALASAGSIG
jgi:ribosomal protein S18 acetylase RimI-like enzyme